MLAEADNRASPLFKRLTGQAESGNVGDPVVKSHESGTRTGDGARVRVQQAGFSRLM